MKTVIDNECQVCSSVNEHCPVKNLDKCKEGLGEKEKTILYLIFKNRKITIDEIHKFGFISKTGIVYRIEGLQERGILKEKDINDDSTEWVISKPCLKLLESITDEEWEKQILINVIQ